MAMARRAKKSPIAMAAETERVGELTAKFDGRHGWFWRNRSDENVTLTLKVKGEYNQMKRVL